MLTTLDHVIGLWIVVWAFPLVFVVHSLEEVVTLERFGAPDRHRIPMATRFIGPTPVTTRTFQLAVAILLMAVLATTIAAARSLQPGFAIDAFAITVVLLLLNVLTHTGHSVLLRTYRPGVVSAVLLVLPYTLYTLHRLDAAELISRDLVPWALLAAVLTPPVLILIHRVAWLLMRKR